MISRSARSIPSSFLTAALGASLTTIKEEDDLTDASMGETMRRGNEQAASYRKGECEMGVVSFLMALHQWRGRFGATALAAVGLKVCPLDAQPQTDRAFQVAVSQLAAQLAVATENSETISPATWAEMQPLLDLVGCAIDARRVACVDPRR